VSCGFGFGFSGSAILVHIRDGSGVVVLCAWYGGVSSTVHRDHWCAGTLFTGIHGMVSFGCN